MFTNAELTLQSLKWSGGYLCENVKSWRVVAQSPTALIQHKSLSLGISARKGKAYTGYLHVGWDIALYNWPFFPATQLSYF